jgi:hypothetical protein
LEGRVGPLFVRLAGDQAISIDPDAQELLAQWLFKTALMVSVTIPQGAAALPRTHYQDLDKSFDLPPASAVWIGRLDSPVQVVALWVQRFDWWDNTLPERGRASLGYGVAMNVGDLAAVIAVLDTRQSPTSFETTTPFALSPFAQGRLLRIWPPSKHFGQRWPPTLTLSQDAVKQIADSFKKFTTGEQPNALRLGVLLVAAA